MSAPSPAPADSIAANHAFDRAAFTILGAMISLILALAAVLISVSVPGPVPVPAPTAQTSPPPHRA